MDAPSRSRIRGRRVETRYELAKREIPRAGIKGESTIPRQVVSIVRENAIHPRLEAEDLVAASPQILPSLYDSRGHLNIPVAMRGSHEILLHQNQMADQDGVTRIQDEDDLSRMRAAKMLVALPTAEGLRIDERLPYDRRFCRPWVSQFLVAIARAHYAQFHTPLQVNSAARTVAVQLRLLRTNGNAAQAGGEAASPHLTGQAVDIAKKGLSQAEIAWIRLYLSTFVEGGRIDVEEEFQQACFHISVYRKFSQPVIPTPGMAAINAATTPALIPSVQ